MGELIELKDAVDLSRKKIARLYGEYVNPGLAELLTTYGFDQHFVMARDNRLWDNHGHCHLDFLGGYGALNFGHNPQEVIQAVEWVKEAPNMLQAGFSELAAALAHNLAQIAPDNLKVTYFANSGTEAVETALKAARGACGKPAFLHCENSYHGKTFGALSVTDNPHYRAPFEPLLEKTGKVPFGDLEKLEAELETGRYSAFIVEPIQGEAGIIVPPPDYLPKAQELCKRYDTLFIVDEIQTGMGRTGKYFACQHYGLKPDIMTIAKSLGGGIMPVGACMMSREVWDMTFGSPDNCTLHSSTFGGNTWAMAAGMASVKLLVEKRLDEQAGKMGEYLLHTLRAKLLTSPLVKEIRGRGLMIGLELQPPHKMEFLHDKMAALVAGELLNKYRILTAYTLNNPNVLRIEPPLTVKKSDIEELTKALGSILNAPLALLQLCLKSGFRILKNRVFSPG